jgi:thioredoxin-related protein
MLKKLFLLLILTLFSMAYDFGTVVQTSVDKIPKGKVLMIEFGKTECIWCEHMAPYFKDIKEQYPKTPIYYINTDIDIMGGINNHIEVLPTAIFWDENGKEIGRHEGYLLPDQIMGLLEKYRVLVK